MIPDLVQDTRILKLPPLKQALSNRQIKSRYLEALISRLTKLQIDQSLVDAVTLWGLIIALIISLYLNFRHRFKAAGRKKRSV